MMASHRPTDPAPVPEQPAAPTAPKPTMLAPSSFLSGFDIVLAVGVLALAFLLASFSVRNSDFFLNLAAGRLIVSGDYPFGKDPFSYVAPERTWVNHAWLFDVGLHLVYKLGGGPAIVVVKAITVALLAGLLLALRKTGQSLWPGVVGVGLALVAAAPRLGVQPVLASYFFFGVLLFVLLRVPRTANSWRFPIIIGVLFWFWANSDQWFFVGPLTLLLYTAAQYLRKDENEDVNLLWKALAIGVVACMLNPNHVRVWTLPPELVSTKMAEMVANDTDYQLMFQGAFSKGAVDFSIGAERDNPANTYALATLFVLVLVGIALNYRQMSLSLLAVWLGTFVLWLLHLRIVPFLAFASAACSAANLAAFGQRLSTRTLNDGTLRVLDMLRQLGRGATAIVGLLLIGLTYPGWLHPLNQQRRWKWDVEPNESMVNAAKKLQEWHDSGAMPPEGRVLNLQPDFANYLAYYAPNVKSYCDYRFAYHEPELQDYVDLKKYISLGSDPAKQAELGFDFQAFLRKHEIVCAVTTHNSRFRNLEIFNALMRSTRPNQKEPDWALLNVDGRGLILGWTPQTVVAPAKIEALRFEAVKQAFAKNAPLKKIENPQGPMPDRDIWDRFVFAPPPQPTAGDEVDIYLAYRTTLIRELLDKTYKEVVPDVRPWQALGMSTLHLSKQAPIPPAALAWMRLNLKTIVDEEVGKRVEERVPPEARALEVLSVRAARRAITQSPNHPDGYWFLAQAYQAADSLDVMGFGPQIRSASLARYIARVSSDPKQRRSTFAVFSLAAQMEGVHASAQPPRVDMQLAAARLMSDYLAYEVELRDEEYSKLNKAEQDETERLRRDLEEQKKRLQIGDEEVQKRRDRYIINVAQLSVPVLRAAEARGYGLAQEALDELLKELERASGQGGNGTTLVRERAQIFAAYAEAIDLLLVAGRAEDAAILLDHVEKNESELRRPELVNEYFLVRRDVAQRKRIAMIHDENPLRQFRYLRHIVGMVTGDFASVQALLEQGLTGTRQDFNSIRQQMLATATAKDPTYTAAKLHEHQLLLAKHLFMIQYLFIERFPFLRYSQYPNQPSMFVTLTTTPTERYIGGLNELLENHVRLGMVFLEEGDLTAARFHFEEATKLPALPVETRSLRLAKTYLKLIPEKLP